MGFDLFPTTQGELIRAARGSRTKVEFAQIVGVDRSCLSRYESEDLGAPTRLINFCLNEVVAAVQARSTQGPQVYEALAHARLAVKMLEGACSNDSAQMQEKARPKRS